MAAGAWPASANFLALDRAPGSADVLVAEEARWWVASPRAFGGQLIAHCLVAAGAVSPFPNAHSLHLHFVNAAHMVRTAYTVRLLRNGRTFILYAVQGVEERSGRIVVSATVGFQAVSPVDGMWAGVRLHTLPMPAAPPPDQCPPGTMEAWADSKAEGLAQIAWQVLQVRSSPSSPLSNAELSPGVPPPYLYWVRWRGGPSEQPLSDWQVEHAAAIGFFSDLQFLWAAFWPHAGANEMQMITSLDHSFYLHSEHLNASEWMLFELSSAYAGAQRALVRGHVWAEDGSFLATCLQEGVLRVRPSKL